LFSTLIVQKMCRRHFLQCPSTLLSKNFEKLIQCDQRLYQLSHQPEIILDSPLFEPRCSIFEDPVESKCTGFTNLKDEHEALPGYSGSLSPCAGSSVSAKNETNDSIGMPAEYLPQAVGTGNSKAMMASSSLLPSLAVLALPYCSLISILKYDYLFLRAWVQIPCTSMLGKPVHAQVLILMNRNTRSFR